MPPRIRVSSRVDSKPPRLSNRERDVLHGLARGGAYEDVAAELGISINTVRAHVRAIYDKADACSRLEAVLWAARHGLLRIDEVA